MKSPEGGEFYSDSWSINDPHGMPNILADIEGFINLAISKGYRHFQIQYIDRDWPTGRLDRKHSIAIQSHIENPNK